MQKDRRKRLTHEEVRKNILRKAVYAFFLNGIKTVTMDAIAASVGISKRTLYEQFCDKEALLLEGMKAYHELIGRKREEITKSVSDLMEQFVHFNRFMEQQFLLICPQFYEDLQRYPKVIEYFQATQHHNAHQSALNLERCVSAGYFRDDIDYETYSYLMSGMMRFTITQYYKNPKELIPILRMIGGVNMRGVCTPLGLQQLERLSGSIESRPKPLTKEEFILLLQEL